jgi:hypothetical protein
LPLRMARVTPNHNPPPTTTHNPDTTRNSTRKRRLLANVDFYSSGVVSPNNKSVRPVSITNHDPCSHDAKTPCCATVSRSTWKQHTAFLQNKLP